MNNTKFKFKLKLIVDSWGSFNEGDTDIFIISLDSLSRHPIDARWEIISYHQYTGMDDKNGAPIFHGDTVKHKYKRIWQTEYHTSTVVWNQDWCCFYLDSGSAQHRMRDDMEYELITN